jgi:sugar/nucleoside kinase (ribokinase family)
MSRMRHTHGTPEVANRPLRILASGTLFVTHTLSLPTQPTPFTVTRAHSVLRTRGGSACCLLSLLAQFNGIQGNTIDGQLIAPLGGDEEGKTIMRALENEGVGLRYCKIWKNVGVPSAWVLQSGMLSVFIVLNSS